MPGWRKRDDAPNEQTGNATDGSNEPDNLYDPDKSYLTTDDGRLATTVVAPLDPGVLTSARARDVRFQRSQPEGYYYPQVEAFVTQAVASLSAMEERQYQTDLALHEAHAENRKLQSENRRHLATLAVFKVNGSPMTNSDGSYVTESQVGQQTGVQAAQQAAADAEARAALSADTAELARTAALRASGELAAAMQALAVAEADTETFRQYGVEMQAYVEQTQEWVTAAQQQLTEQAAALAAYATQHTQGAAVAQPQLTDPVPEPAQPAYDRPSYAQQQALGSPEAPVSEKPRGTSGGTATTPEPVARLRQPRNPEGT